MANETEIKKLSDKYGVEGDLIRALIGITEPGRKRVKMVLTSYKEQLKGYVLYVGYKGSLSLRKRTEAVKIQQKVQDQVSRIRSVLNMLNIADEFEKTASIQPIVSILVSAVSSNRINSFSDLEAAANKAAYQARRVVKAAMIAETTARKINNKIDEVARYIAILDEIEKLPA